MFLPPLRSGSNSYIRDTLNSSHTSGYGHLPLCILRHTPLVAVQGVGKIQLLRTASTGPAYPSFPSAAHPGNDTATISGFQRRLAEHPLSAGPYHHLLYRKSVFAKTNDFIKIYVFANESQEKILFAIEYDFTYISTGVGRLDSPTIKGEVEIEWLSE